jgi:hypothetical protein
MTAAIAKIKSHFANWREWELNPIVIKELRQGVRSWTVTGMLLLFLVVLFITSLGFLITESFDVNTNMGLGGTMFSAFIVILAVASIFFIPLYTGVRVAAERQENNPDLLYVTTLSPARIIRGKFLCGAYLALLFFSACLPFMAFTNLLRGVDLPTVFFILAFLFLIVCAVNMFAIFLASLPMSRPFKFLFVIYGFFQGGFIIVSMISRSFMFMRAGVGAMMTERDFWIGTATAVFLILTVIGLFYVLSVALISPPSANRALPVRLYLTGLWLLGGLLCFNWLYRTGGADIMNAWLFLTFATAMFALLVIISNADQLSQRVRRTIPRSGLKRPLAFLFFNGAAGGLIWVGGILVATFLATRTILVNFSSAAAFDEDHVMFATTGTYAFGYALTALFLHRKFLPRRPPKLAGLIAMLLAGAWAILPSIALFFLNRLTWKSVEGLQLGNLFNVFFTRDSGQLVYHEYFALGWLLLAVILNAKWFVQQVKNFKPPEKIEPPPAITKAPREIGT